MRLDCSSTLEGERRSLYTQIGQKARVQEQDRNGKERAIGKKRNGKGTDGRKER
jgi:hypothetical protein